VADERAPVAPERIVADLLAAAGLAPSPEEIAELARGYAALRAGLDSLYLPEADAESPLPDWLLREASRR
jgi:hypothetical protein